MTNSDDAIATIADMIGSTPKEVEDLIANLPLDRSDDLFDAVVEGDVARVLVLLDVPALTDEPSEDDDEGDDVTESFRPGVGMSVRVNGQEGTVRIPHGPRNTVGVVIDGDLQMVRRGRVKPALAEAVMGMTAMPDLQRMMALAGVAGREPTPAIVPARQAPPAAVTIEVATEEPCLGEILRRFDEIEATLPDLKLRDAKAVRARLTSLSQKINETRRRR